MRSLECKEGETGKANSRLRIWPLECKEGEKGKANSRFGLLSGKGVSRGRSMGD
jgi:hypothetical protein